MKLSSITSEQGAGDIFIEDLSELGNSSILKSGNDVINVTAGSGDANNFKSLRLNRPIKVKDLKSLWDDLYLGTSRFKISERLKFQIDPMWSKLTMGNSVTYYGEVPEDNEIDQISLTLLRNKAHFLGYNDLEITTVNDLFYGNMYTDDTAKTKSLGGYTYTSNVVTRQDDDLPDIYDLVLIQHRFWVSLKSNVLITEPSKTLPTLDTLGNTIPLYSYGEVGKFTLAKVVIRYKKKGSNLVKSVSFEIYKSLRDPYSKTELLEGVQVIWVENGVNSFLKLLYMDDIIEECYISHAKLID